MFYSVCVSTVLGPPSDVIITEVTSNCTIANVLWNKPFNAPDCGMLFYDVIILPSNGIMNGTNKTGLSHMFTRLTPNTNYTVFVIGRNNAGSGSMNFETLMGKMFSTQEFTTGSSPKGKL